MASPKPKNIAGHTFGELTAVELVARHPPRWKCICTCGGERVERGVALRAGVVNRCQKCDAVACANKRQEAREKQYKLCRGCGSQKQRSEFYKSSVRIDGMQQWCKQCLDAKRDKKQSAYFSRRYYHERGGKERSLEWSRSNRDKRAQYWNKHYEANRERMVFQKTVETYVRRGAPGKFTKDDIDALLIKQSGRCAYCSCELMTYHVDHILPISRGGTSWPNNIQLTCPRCNHSKRNRDAPLYLEAA